MLKHKVSSTGWLFVSVAVLFVIYTIIDFFFINKMSETGYIMLLIVLVNALIQLGKKPEDKLSDNPIKTEKYRQIMIVFTVILICGGIFAAIHFA